jgi:hypothetical protein
MRVLLPPLSDMCLVIAISGEELIIAKVRQDITALLREQYPDILRVRQINFTQLRGNFLSSGI